VKSELQKLQAFASAKFYDRQTDTQTDKFVYTSNFRLRLKFDNVQKLGHWLLIDVDFQQIPTGIYIYTRSPYTHCVFIILLSENKVLGCKMEKELLTT
jgi:hypothetical protein